MRQFVRPRESGGYFREDLPSGGVRFISPGEDEQHFIEMHAAVERGEAEFIAPAPEPEPDTTPTQAEEIAALRKAVKGDMTDLEALDARR
jgi:hypothetical protein